MFINHFSKLLLLLCGLIFWVDIASSNSELIDPLSSKPLTDSQALFSLALQHEHAEGVPRDKQKAFKLFCKAAKLGHADAQYALGWIYANGRSVPRDDSIALQLFTRAAKQGHIHAKRMISYMSTSSVSTLPKCMQSVAKNRGIDYSKNPIFKLVKQLAPQYNLDPELVMAVISVESGFNLRAVSPSNAQGLMQLIPATAERFQVKNTFDAKDNIKGGMAYLRWLMAFFKGNVSLVAAAYNAGEGAVEKYRGIPPYPETQKYVKKIKARYKKLIHPYQPDIVNRHAFLAVSSLNNK